MAGSLIIVEADDLAAAEAFNAADPYAKAGLFERVEIRAFRRRPSGRLELSPTTRPGPPPGVRLCAAGRDRRSRRARASASARTTGIFAGFVVRQGEARARLCRQLPARRLAAGGAATTAT